MAQLMYVADHYLRRATSAKHEMAKMGTTARYFGHATPISRPIRRLTLLAAHLASAAIRLASTEKILKSVDQESRRYAECAAYFAGKGPDIDLQTRPDWLHIMLRDAIGHEEPLLKKSGKRPRRWNQRQRCIEATTFSAAYSALRGVAKALRTCR